MLISIVLYALGIPLWMIIGMLLLALWNRNRVKKQPATFPVKVRAEPDAGSDKPAKWPRMVGYAQWVHDVLIVRSGMGLMIAVPYGIASLEGVVEDVDPDVVKGLGNQPVVLRARLDDRSVIQFAVDETHPDLAPDRMVGKDGVVD